MPLSSYKMIHRYIDFFCCSQDFTSSTPHVNHQNPQRQGDRLSIANSSSTPPPACKRDPNWKCSKMDTDISRWLVDVHIFAKRIHRSFITVCTVHSIPQITSRRNLGCEHVDGWEKQFESTRISLAGLCPPTSSCARSITEGRAELEANKR